MRKILLLLSLLVAFSCQAFAADNYAATAGSGLTFGAKDAAGVLYSRFIGCDNTTVSQCWQIDSSGRQLITITSGSVASGAFASGSIASGAMVDLGAQADAACGTASGTCSLIALTKYLNTSVNSGVGTPGSAVPSTGIYIGGNVSGNFRGWTGVNPSGSVYSQQMDLASVNGVTASTGTGAVGTGTPRVAVGTDTATVAGTAPATAGIAATGAAPPAGSIQVAAVASGATGGLMAGLKTCDQHAKYDASTSGSTTLVTGVASRKVYICGFILATGGTATNVKLREGSDANCATNAADLTPAYQLVANDKIGMQAAFWTGLGVSTNAYYVCVNASAANAVQAEIWYTIQ